MNQLSAIGVGADNTKLLAYGVVANGRLGRVDLIIENTGSNDAYISVKEFVPTWDGTTAGFDTSTKVSKGVVQGSWTSMVSSFPVVAGGTATKKLVIVSKTIGFFGSGDAGKSTTLNITPVIRNPADLRGAQFDLFNAGHQAFGYDIAFDVNAFTSPSQQ